MVLMPRIILLLTLLVRSTMQVFLARLTLITINSLSICVRVICFFFQAEDGIRDVAVTGVQTWLFRSELLASLLDAHPAIVSEGEILQRPRRYPTAYLRGHALRMMFRARRGSSMPRVHGWKLITNHVRWYPDVFPDPKAFVADLAADGEIIHLRRRDLLSQAISLLSAEVTQFHVRTVDPRSSFEPIAFEPIAF